ncbi:MAG: CHAD domain-containing protein [Xanthomonadales bacterium]|nr:CHAD domain-containing protein [Xanthomonadales bacterium]
MSVEIELKLAVDPAGLKRLLRAPDLQRIARGPARSESLDSTYFDTATLDLTRAGLALRLRKRGRSWVQTLKTRGSSQAGLHARGEYETAAPGGRIDLEALCALEGVAELLLPFRDSELKPLFTTAFRRSRFDVNLEDGGIAELAFDLGEIRAEGSIDPISEIEIELKSGAPRELYALARELLRLEPLQLDNRSKAQRGFALLAPIEPIPAKATAPSLDAGTPAQHACATLLASALEQLEANESGVIAAHDPEYLHQARVALRRLRALLRLFSPLLTLGEIDALKPRLRAVGQALGACRDWDVLCTETLPRLGAGMTRPEALEALAQAVRARRLAAQATVRECLAARDYTDLKLALGALIAELAQPTGESAPALIDFARERLRKAARRVRRCHAQHDPACIDSLHGLRIEVKKLRYACDVLGSVFGERPLRRYVRHLSALQQLLGDFNDAAVARQRVATLEGIEPFARGVLEGYAAARTEAARDALPAAWTEFEQARRFW